MLRVAIGMDRNHDGAVERVVVKDEGDVVRLELVGEPGADLSLEVYTATERSNMLADQLGATVEIVAAT